MFIMIEIKFTSTSELRFDAELITGAWIETIVPATDPATTLRIESFGPQFLSVAGVITSHVFRAAEDSGNPFLVLKVTNNSGDLEIGCPGQASFIIPQGGTTTVLYSRSQPVFKEG